MADDAQLRTTRLDDGLDDEGVAASPALPRAVGRYRIRDCVGAGGMGVVFRGYDPKLHRDVAIKLLRPSFVAGPVAQQQRVRLLREARAMAQLSHPNVVPVFDVGEHDDGLFVAMQYVPGPNARQWCGRVQPSWRRVLGVYRAAGRGLAATHAVGLVHRDFKPANIIVGDDGRVRVLDFGLARAMADLPAPAVPDPVLPEPGWSESITNAGAVVGTPMYMAPEQLRGMPIDARADQYAFCVSLYESLYGGSAFAATKGRELLRSKVEHRLVVPAADATTPRALFRIIERGTSPDPDDRFPTMPDVLRALRAVAERPAPSRRRGWMWSIVAVSVVAAAWLAWPRSAGLPDHERVTAPYLRAAYFDAVRERDPEAAAAAAIDLVEAGGPDAADWAAHAEAQLEAAGNPPDLVDRFRRARGSLSRAAD